MLKEFKQFLLRGNVVDLKEPSVDPTTKKCTECISEIPIMAKRCSHCTQVVF